MESQLSPSAQKVQAALHRAGFLSLEVVELPTSTRTADEAASAIGCQIGQIVKSLIFKTAISAKPVLVLASGENRVDEKLIPAYTVEEIVKADAQFVRQQTGFVIGGVPPVGHIKAILTLIDEDLLQYEYIWAAAGTPHAVFCMRSDDMVEITSGRVLRIKLGG